MLPRHASPAAPRRREIRVSCCNLRETGLVVYETGRGTILAGLLFLAAMAAYGEYLNSPAAEIQVVQQNVKKQVRVQADPEKHKRVRTAWRMATRNYAAHVRSAVNSAGSRHNIDPRLIQAVIEVESRGNPNAVSPRGAKGLMQITPGICKRYGVSDPFDIEQNINAGAAYLAHLLESLNGDLERALAAYNCGLGRVSMSTELPPFSETRIFVDKIINRYRSRILKDLAGEG